MTVHHLRSGFPFCFLLHSASETHCYYGTLSVDIHFQVATNPPGQSKSQFLGTGFLCFFLSLYSRLAALVFLILQIQIQEVQQLGEFSSGTLPVRSEGRLTDAVHHSVIVSPNDGLAVITGEIVNVGKRTGHAVNTRLAGILVDHDAQLRLGDLALGSEGRGTGSVDDALVVAPDDGLAVG